MKEEDCRGQELCEQGGGPGLSLIPYPSLSPSLINRTVSADVKHRCKKVAEDCARPAPFPSQNSHSDSSSETN